MTSGLVWCLPSKFSFQREKHCFYLCHAFDILSKAKEEKRFYYAITLNVLKSPLKSDPCSMTHGCTYSHYQTEDSLVYKTLGEKRTNNVNKGQSISGLHLPGNTGLLFNPELPTATNLQFQIR